MFDSNAAGGGASANYGFRLFVVQIFDGMKQTPMPFKICGRGGYVEHARRLLGDHAEQTVVEAGKDSESDEDPNAVEVEPPATHLAGRRGFEVQVAEIKEGLLYGEILVGTFGGHERALAEPDRPPQLVDVDDPDAPDPDDLSGRAPARRYRFILNAPSESTHGILAVEDISRSCPVDPLVGWLKRWGRDAADAVGAKREDDDDRPSARWWRIRTIPAVDFDHFERIIRNGQIEKIELVKYAIGQSGRRGTVGIRLEAPNPSSLGEGVTEQLLSMVGGWAEGFMGDRAERRRRARGERRQRQSLTREQLRQPEQELAERARNTDSAAANAMAAVLGEGVQEVGFDDGWLVVDQGGEKTKISPSRINDTFVYPVTTEGRPLLVGWYGVVRGTALRLNNALELDVEWPERLDT